MHTYRPQRFEKFVAELLKRIGMNEVVSNHVFAGAIDHEYEIDILFGVKDDVTIVEVKGYRYLSPPSTDVFERALQRLMLLKHETHAAHLLLAISCPLTARLAQKATEYPKIEIWDAHKFLELAAPFPDLLRQLEEILERTASDILEVTSSISQPVLRSTDIGKGEELALELRAIRPGRKDASKFEDKCIAALKYLFEKDLFGWHEQHETDDGLHRRDLVCRILPSAEVWKLMMNDLRSRYVIFEFKNYSEPITQRELITTERYLYPSALRNIAIIISPFGCSSSAKKVAQGAMREHGKLMISLTVTELTALLIGMDQGSDANTFLFERIDEFLMSLGR